MREAARGREGHEGEQDDGALVPVELVLVIDYGAHEELDGDLGEEKRRRRGGGYGYDERGLAEHPEDEGGAVEEIEELVQVMCWLGDGAEEGDEHGARADEEGPAERPARERLPEDEGGADGVEDQA
ncbi:hypothetical protein V493_02356 [Pseudogymnoascus sp. VKM F-4281 (FW-2241)]|nr:hypothetical protein V493_02356 [Pseudogymnoascus sp. VKM F-4281 (FW-2241)]